MSTPSPDLLVEQRLALRQRLLAQRQLLAEQLAPKPARSGDYPRSMTMRLLTGHPALANQLLVEGASVVLGVRLVRSLTRSATLVRLVGAIWSRRRQGAASK